jgi:hypothetical protein
MVMGDKRYVLKENRDFIILYKYGFRLVPMFERHDSRDWKPSVLRVNGDIIIMMIILKPFIALLLFNDIFSLTPCNISQSSLPNNFFDFHKLEPHLFVEFKNKLRRSYNN